VGEPEADLTDPDNPEWTAADFDASVRVADYPSLEAAEAAAREKYAAVRRRGPQKAPRKQMVSIRLDAHIVARFRATGKGWQGRMNDTLAKHLPRPRRAAARRRTAARRSTKATR
jgi:uncharacterized protein (DUF4415 family)